MATFHVYNDFPASFMKYSAEYTIIWAGLINDSVSVTDTPSYRYRVPSSRLRQAVEMPGARWRRSGNTITLFAGDVYFPSTDYRTDGPYKITHIGVFMANPAHTRSAGIGFVQKSWDFRQPEDGGNGSLRVRWNPLGIVSIELIHG